MTSEKIDLNQLYQIIDAKIKTKEAGSYSNEIASQGVEKITRKIGEEATEVIIAAFQDEKLKTPQTRQDLVGEVCDLFYHNLILLAERGIDFEEIIDELTKRNAKYK